MTILRVAFRETIVFILKERKELQNLVAIRKGDLKMFKRGQIEYFSFIIKVSLEWKLLETLSKFF